MSSAALRELIALRFPDAVPAAQRSWSAVPTGVGELDGILPSGGFQRGRISTWAPVIGAAALLRAAALHTVAHGERAVWIDGTGTVAGACWRPGPLLIRPRDRRAALRAAVELARSGGFALVVLDGVDPETTELVRISRAAHEGGTAFVLLSRVSAMATLRLTSRALVERYVWRRSVVGDVDDVEQVCLRVEARASGWFAHAVVSLPLWRNEIRVALEPGMADRRGQIGVMNLSQGKKTAPNFPEKLRTASLSV